MMDAQLEVKLIECLDALAQGESVEQILARYPQDAAQLRPLLQTAAGLPALRMEPSEAVKILQSVGSRLLSSTGTDQIVKASIIDASIRKITVSSLPDSGNLRACR